MDLGRRVEMRRLDGFWTHVGDKISGVCYWINLRWEVMVPEFLVWVNWENGDTVLDWEKQTEEEVGVKVNSSASILWGLRFLLDILMEIVYR